MSDLFKTNENEFYIELKQERYYFPGDHVAGGKKRKENKSIVYIHGIFFR